jgi:hypothetical protein
LTPRSRFPGGRTLVAGRDGVCASAAMVSGPAVEVVGEGQDQLVFVSLEMVIA